MITIDDYFQSYDAAPKRDLRREYALALTPDIERNAARWVATANLMLTHLGVHVEGLNSGWRPPAYNAKTPGAARFSRHMTGEAGDITDHDGMIDELLLHDWETNRTKDQPGKPVTVLAKFGFWMEHPSATKGWSHQQLTPQPSFKTTGNRVFYP